MTLRVLTLNIWNRNEPWAERLRAIRAGLSDLRPDVIGLQEVIRPGPHEALDQASAIAEGFGYHVAFGPTVPGGTFGNAVLSRWPILRQAVWPLPRVGTDEDRVLLLAEIDAPFGRLPFFVTHLNWKLDEGHVREEQVKEVAARVLQHASPDHFPAILCGDFNASPDSDEIRFLRGLTSLGGSRRVHFNDCFAYAGDGSPGYTFTRANPFAAPLREPNRRVDYIFVHGPRDDGRGEPLECHVCFDAPFEGVLATDHYGVTAVLRTTKR